MNDILYINAASKRYPIYMGESFSGLADAAAAAFPSGHSCVIVTDTNVAPLYHGSVKAALQSVFETVSTCVFEAGEGSKNIDALQEILGHMLQSGADRKTPVFALGGGVCGDMAGFAASIYMRGVPFAQIPTTLLSMVDSSVGGKTGVDFKGYKNAIGAFCQPEFVYINQTALTTLPKREFSSGLGEVVKHGLIGGGEYLSFLENNREGIARLDSEAVKEVILGSCRIKGAVVESDERESGLREVLNFGHTFGHAIETDSGFKIPHGECVAIGMAAAVRLSSAASGLSESAVRRALPLISAYGLMTEYKTEDPGETANRLIKLMYSDKKAGGGKINAVVLEDLGKPRPIKDAGETALRAALEFVLV